jgi:NDP-sugar pyrophosphorylase family protein
VTRVVVNAHHLAGVLEETLGGSYRGLRVDVSVEPEILGTAGAIRRARDAGFLGDEPFLVVNGDLFTTLGLGRLLAARRGEGVVSALAVVPNERPDVDTPLWADARGRLSGIGSEAPPYATGPWLFTGIQAARAPLAERIGEGKQELAKDVLRPSLERGDGAFALVPYRLPGDGLWFDLGTPERLAAAEAEVSRRGLG